MGNERLTTTAKARSLGVVLDDNMLFDVHVSEICRSSFIEECVIHRGRRLENISHGSQGNYYCTVRSDDVKVLKFRWNFVKTKATTPGNNIYTLLITFIAFTSFFSSKFKLYFSHTNSHITLGPPGGWLLLKCSAVGIGFNRAETNCGIARILGILLMNSCDTKI